MATLSLSGGPDLYYEVRGESGPFMVLLNGMSQSTANWMSQSRKLSEAFRVVTYDARGQGKTPVGNSELTLDLHLRDLEELLDHLDAESAVLCGFSFGARLALGFAALHPERVSRLVLTSTGSGNSALRRTIVASWAEILNLGGVEAMAWCALPQILGEDFLTKYERQIPSIIRTTGQRNSKEGLQALLSGYKGFPGPMTDAPSVEAETLLITSDLDTLVSPENARELADALPDVVHRVMDGVGHTIPIESPELWRTWVEEFLGSA